MLSVFSTAGIRQMVSPVTSAALRVDTTLKDNLHHGVKIPKNGRIGIFTLCREVLDDEFPFNMMGKTTLQPLSAQIQEPNRTHSR